MNTTALVQFAAARGINLQHIAGFGSNVDGVARQRARTAIERKAGTDVQLTVRGRESRVARPPGWSHAELGQAAKDLGVIPWSAALYSFAGNQDGFWVLWSALNNEANKIARRENWATKVITEDGHQRFYREQLSELVLVADSNRQYFDAAPDLYAAYMNVSAPTWQRQLSDPFRSLKGRYEGWLAVARSVIGKWVRRED